jgi:hypothetical protein
MDRDAGRLVDDDELSILMNDRVCDEVAERLRGQFRSSALLALERRHSDSVPFVETVLGSRSAPIHTHFAGAKDAIDQAPRNVFEVPSQEVVDALPRVTGPGVQVGHRCSALRCAGTLLHNHA